MSWETLLEAAKFVELQEEQERLRARAREETPPSHEEFPSSFCSALPKPLPKALPLLDGHLTSSEAREAPPAPTPVVVHLPVLGAASAPAPPSAAPLAPNHPPPHQSSPQPGAPAPPAPVPSPVLTSTPAPSLYLHTPDSPSAASQDDDLLGQDSRRRTGSGTREVHNKLEKNRRAHLKECFEMLKRQLPTCQEEKKCSNLSILHSAFRYIQSLRRKEREFEHEMERLAREKISAQQRLACLKKDLAAQWDHIDFNALYPDHPDCVDSASARDGRLRLPSPTSTSTASAELEGGMIIDEDEDDDDDDDTMSFHSGRQRSASDSSSALPTAPPANPPNPRDVHGYRGESPQLPVRCRSPVSPRPRASSPGILVRDVRVPAGHPGRGLGVTTNGHAAPVADINVYKVANAVDRGASAPSSGFVPAKLLNYSIKVASPASTPLTLVASSSPPGPSRVPSSPVGTLTTLPGHGHAGHAHGHTLAHGPPLGDTAKSRTSPSAPIGPGALSNVPSPPGPALQPVASMALPLTSHHIQLPIPAQVVSNGRWLGVSPTILQLTTPTNQRLVLDATASLTQHNGTANGATPLVTHHRMRDLGGAVSAPLQGSLSSPADTATAAITIPTMHTNKVMVGATGISPGVTIVSDENFHKSSSPDGIRPTSDVGVLCGSKGLQISKDSNGHLLSTSVHSGSASLPAHVTHVVSAHPSLSPLVTPVTVHGSPVAHILTTSPIAKMSPLIKTMPLVNSQYLGVVKPTMVVVSSASNHPPNSGV